MALLPGLLAAASGDAACLLFASHPDGAPLAQFALPADDPTFVVTYVHSVTRTPVAERYRVEGDAIVQTEIRFAQHGPGLPTQPDTGGTFEQRDGEFVASMQRRFAVIVMRVHADQSPRFAAGGCAADLAAWGNRALAVRATDDACAAH
mgnify:FL=1